MADQFSGYSGSCLMKTNGLFVELNMPLATKSAHDLQGNEIAQGLPPYNPRKAFVVDEYPACPKEWVQSTGTTASYFVPILLEHGLWLDFNPNKNHPTHHVAVLISIQGINPITGRKTAEVRLEQYRKKCPKHEKPFGYERFCGECGYKWDAQNYLASNATPNGAFWLDGFRAEDGTVRQYVFTEQISRGVAAQIIGEERVFAIGIAFFLSKDPKPQPIVQSDRMRSQMHQLTENVTGSEWNIWNSHPVAEAEIEGLKTLGGVYNPSKYHRRVRSAGLNTLVLKGHDARFARSSTPQLLEISAGAKIAQRIYPDPEELTFWADKPTAQIFINYVSVEDAQKILAGGKNDRTGGGEGFMKGLHVGN